MSDDKPESWTVLKLLEWTTDFFKKRQLNAPRLEAELLLSYALGMQRIMLYASFDRPMEPSELATFRKLVKRRAAHEPVAYITGSRGFWTLDLKTDARALIPRPDSERLVELACAQLPKGAPSQALDIGTGTGAIALAIASERPQAQVIATDISDDALALARENADALGLTERVRLAQGDLFDALTSSDGPFDVIVSNPPYVGTDELALVATETREHEPHLALFAGADGLDVLRALIPQALSHLKPGGALLCEMGFRQGAAVRALFEEAGYERVVVKQDLARHDRVVMGFAPQ